MSDMRIALPCEPCLAAKIFPQSFPEHACLGTAHGLEGVPCPCCEVAAPMRFCRQCDRPIQPGEPFKEQLVQSASGADGATNYVHTPCPPGGTA